jgi:hypothetical protein
MPKQIKGQRIDWLSAEILRILHDEGGNTTTRTLTEETGMKNDRINYRYDLLEAAELITTNQPSFDEDSRKFPPKEITLTDEGEHAVNHYDLPRRDDTERLTVDDRLTRMESRLNRLENELAHAYERIEASEVQDEETDLNEAEWGWKDDEIDL